MDCFQVNLYDLQPSQVYISAAKLASVQYALGCGGTMLLEPIQVKQMGEHLVITEGHTRSLALYLQGYQTVKAVWEPDELDEAMYDQCVVWCQEEGISKVSDLSARVVCHEAFEAFWLQRCRVMHILIKRHQLGPHKK